LGITLSFVFFLQGSGVASSFPFRAINVGDQLPPVVMQSLGGQPAGSPAQFAGKPLLLLFFGADLPAKKERAVKTLKAVRELAAFAAAQGLLTLVVDVQGDAESVMAEVATSAGFTGDLYADVDNRVYGTLGIFVLPSVLLVAADGTVVAGLGYSSDFGQRLKGEIEVMKNPPRRRGGNATLSWHLPCGSAANRKPRCGNWKKQWPWIRPSARPMAIWVVCSWMMGDPLRQRPR
jgi:hypothetical protein